MIHSKWIKLLIWIVTPFALLYVLIVDKLRDRKK